MSSASRFIYYRLMLLTAAVSSAQLALPLTDGPERDAFKDVPLGETALQLQDELAGT
jgi:hypothetical protein